MKQTWRWFGPGDAVAIEEIEQTGAAGVVTALYHVPAGQVWLLTEIERRQAEIARRSDGTTSSLAWEVVESLVVSEDIKRQTGDWRTHIANYKTSLENLAAAGVHTVCYNFMPVLDWTRTNTAWRLSDGATCMRFDVVDFAIFDLFILRRVGAEVDYAADVLEAAQKRHVLMTEQECAALTNNVVNGLPGANQTQTFEDFRVLLSSYAEIDADQLRSNLHDFLKEVIPVAERLGLRLCCHPDDPPFPILGLPRVVSTEADYAYLIGVLDSPANGITLCSGSMGVRADNDLPGMMSRLGHRVHFIHLRNVRREDDYMPGSFHEAAHLDGSTDMVALIAAILAEEKERQTQGRADWNIPMRPDHGHEMIDDFKREKQPGYPLIGRLRGLAELRGVITALSSENVQFSSSLQDLKKCV